MTQAGLFGREKRVLGRERTTPMRTIIAGSRPDNGPEFSNTELLFAIFNAIPWEVTLVLNGEAHGVDTAAMHWADMRGTPHEEYPYGRYIIPERSVKAAGPIRNAAMIKNADAAVVIWDGGSPGSGNLLQQATREQRKREFSIWEVRLVWHDPAWIGVERNGT